MLYGFSIFKLVAHVIIKLATNINSLFHGRAIIFEDYDKKQRGEVSFEVCKASAYACRVHLSIFVVFSCI